MPDQYHCGRYYFKDGKFTLDTSGFTEIYGGKVMPRKDDPSYPRWRGLFKIKGGDGLLAGVLERMCNMEEGEGMIFSFPTFDESLFRNMIGATNEDYVRHRSKLMIESFAMGTLINGAKFCSHFQSGQTVENSCKKDSHDSRDSILRFDLTSKKVNFFLKVSGNETKDTIEIERFKLVYKYQSIKRVFVKKCANGIVHLYFHLGNAPQILISKGDYIRKDLNLELLDSWLDFANV